MSSNVRAKGGTNGVTMLEDAHTADAVGPPLERGVMPRRARRCLDLFCGAGGAGMGLHRAGPACAVDAPHRRDRLWIVTERSRAVDHGIGARLEGLARRVEPSIRLLAHGVPARVGRLRAYGNAIVPQVAAEVIGAYMDAAASGVAA